MIPSGGRVCLRGALPQLRHLCVGLAACPPLRESFEFRPAFILCTAAAVAASWGYKKKSLQSASLGWRGLVSCEASPTSATHSPSEWQPVAGGGLCREHMLQVPLKHGQEGPQISIFAREVILEKNKEKVASLPVLLFLQGGPGFPAARPGSAKGGWLGRGLEDFRVVLLDQRGTGRSTAITAQTLKNLPSKDQAEFLANFRADSIVQDCEALRTALGVEKLSLLGQSFGGFCALTYLSFFPKSLENVFITGGLAPIHQTADDVYRATYHRVIERNRRFYKRYPADVQKVREIVKFLEAAGPKGVPLPDGGRLTVRRFLSLGLEMGMGNGLEAMHWLVEAAFVIPVAGGPKQLDERFLTKITQAQAFDTNPIYWLLHEAIYCGKSTGPSNWSACRVLQEPEFATKFDYKSLIAAGESEPILFTGEMVYPWLAEDYPTLGALQEAAEILAAKSDWPDLYDLEKLKDTQVRVAAAMYYDDFYVERTFSEQVVRLLGDKCAVWVTNEYMHSGIRDDGSKILDTLIKMAKGEAGIPS